MKDKSRFLWIYCIILFTSALILILVSAVTQQKLSRDMETYREKLSHQEGLFQGAQKSLVTLNKENQILHEKIKELEEKINKLQEEIKQNNEDIAKLQEQSDMIKISVDNLLKAEEFFKKKQYIESASHLVKVNYELLSEDTKKIYDTFANTVLNQAAFSSYTTGYKKFRNNEIEDAIEHLTMSLQFKKDAYYSDDAMYFLAISYLKQNNTDEAKKTLLQLKEQYPESTYIKAADEQLSKIE